MGLYIGPELPLEITGKTEGEPLSSAENVLVVETDSRGNAEEGVGIGGGLQIHLYTLDFALSERDMTVDRIAVHRGHLDTHIIENPQRGEPVVIGIDPLFAVQVTRLDNIDIRKHFLPEWYILGMGYLNFSYMILQEWFRTAFRLVAGIVASS